MFMFLLGFATCAVVSIVFPKKWAVIQTMTARGVAAVKARFFTSKK